jgi:glutathione S-transferase
MLRGKRSEKRLVGEPRELCFDARDQCAPCGQPVVTPTDQAEQLLESGNFAQDAHDVDAVPQIEERRTIRTLRIMDPIRDEMAESRQRRADAAAAGGQLVPLERMLEARPHHQRVDRDIAKRDDRSRLADAFGFAGHVLDRLFFGSHELAEQLLEQASTLGLRLVHACYRRAVGMPCISEHFSQVRVRPRDALARRALLPRHGPVHGAAPDRDTCSAPHVPRARAADDRGMLDARLGIMKLYYSPGACSLAPHIALREIERSFELERVDLRAHRTASGVDFYTINPKGYVPALRLDGPGSMLLTENAAILQYIADLAPERRLAPANGTFARYHLQEWLSFIGSEIHKQFGPLFQPDTPGLVEGRVRGKLGERFGYLSKVLAERDYVMGETFTVADCYLVAVLRWCDRFLIDLHAWTNLEHYYARVLHRATVQAALAAEGLFEPKRMRRSA